MPLATNPPSRLHKHVASSLRTMLGSNPYQASCSPRRYVTRHACASSLSIPLPATLPHPSCTSLLYHAVATEVSIQVKNYSTFHPVGHPRPGCQSPAKEPEPRPSPRLSVAPSTSQALDLACRRRGLQDVHHVQHAGDGDAVVQQVVVLQTHGPGVPAVPAARGATGRAESCGASGANLRRTPAHYPLIEKVETHGGRCTFIGISTMNSAPACRHVAPAHLPTTSATRYAPQRSALSAPMSHCSTC